MSSPFILGRDINGYVGYTLPPSAPEDMLSWELTDGQEATFTIPNNWAVWSVVFSFEPGTSVWVAYNDTAALPNSATVASTGSEQNPNGKTLNAGTIVSMITGDTTAKVSASLWYIR